MSAIKHRSIMVENMRCEDCEKTIQDALRELDGVREAVADSRRGRVHVSYDLLEIGFEDIERKLAEIGHPAGGDVIRRIRHKMLHYTEQNERDNLTAGHRPCCGDYIRSDEHRGDLVRK